MSRATLHCGDALEVLRTLSDESARCCVTSPPYWGLRDYGVAGQLGLERVLAVDGTLWLNMGDCYAGGPSSRKHDGTRIKRNTPGLKPKDLVMMPHRVALALQAEGWWVRSDTVWAKPNPMPESCRDRPTRSHEYIFLLSRSERYFYDYDAVREPVNGRRDTGRGGHTHLTGRYTSGNRERRHEAHKLNDIATSFHWEDNGKGRNMRSVWTMTTRPYHEAHFATFPKELAERCILAGSEPGDTVLDPFGGSGTTAAVATGLGRDAVHIDLHPDYLELARQRIGPMFCDG